MIRASLVAALLLLVALPAHAADKIHLRSGSVLEGTIESHDAEAIVLRSGTETLRIPQRLVDRVELGERPVPVAAPAKPAGTPKPGNPGKGAAAAPDSVPAAPSVPPVVGPAAPAGGPVDAALLSRMAATETATRAAAMEAVVAGWPGTAGTLDAALRHAEASVRCEAIALLGREELGDTSSRIRASLADAEANARAAAVRQVRNREVPGTEATLVQLLTSDSAVMVRLEALRTLEELGTAACLPAVLQAWIAEPAETERDRRRRYVRVLRKLTGEDAGEDRVANADAWRLAIERAATRRADERRSGGAVRAPERPAPAPADAARK